MLAPRSLAVALALGSVLGISCYSEPLPPSTYRFSCQGDGDCNGDEVCLSGRCERPCHPLPYLAALLVGVDGPCPFEGGYAGCYNGICANTCDLDNDLCPSGRRCVDVGIEVDGGGGGFGGGGGGGQSAARYGVCIFECTDGGCPLGQVCNDEGRCGPDPELLCLSSEELGVELDYCFQPCIDDTGCPDDFYCEPSFSSCAPRCSPECPEGQTCFLGACTPACGDGGSCADGQCCRFDRICTAEDVELPFPGGECASEGTTSDGSTSDGTTSDGSTDGTTSDGTTSDGTTSDGSTSDGTTSDGSTSGM